MIEENILYLSGFQLLLQHKAFMKSSKMKRKSILYIKVSFKYIILIITQVMLCKCVFKMKKKLLPQFVELAQQMHKPKLQVYIKYQTLCVLQLCMYINVTVFSSVPSEAKYYYSLNYMTMTKS